MIDNHMLNLRQAFNKWRQGTQLQNLADAMTAERKKLLLNNLNKFMGNNNLALLRLVLHRFEDNSKIRSVHERFFIRLLMTKAGGVIDSISKWKALPEP